MREEVHVNCSFNEDCCPVMAAVTDKLFDLHWRIRTLVGIGTNKSDPESSEMLKGH